MKKVSYDLHRSINSLKLISWAAKQQELDYQQKVDNNYLICTHSNYLSHQE